MTFIYPTPKDLTASSEAPVKADPCCTADAETVSGPCCDPKTGATTKDPSKLCCDSAKEKQTAPSTSQSSSSCCG